MKIEIPKLNDLKEIDKIAIQVHNCHVKWRPDIFEYTDNIINEDDFQYLIKNNQIFVTKINNEIVGYVILSSREGKKNGYKYRKELDIDAMGVDENYRKQAIRTKILEF